MNRQFSLSLVLMVAATTALAQLSPSQKAETERRSAIFMRGIETVYVAAWDASADCSTNQVRVPYPYAEVDKADFFKPARETTRLSVISITGWTGGCKDGKRDGHGVLSWRIENRQEADPTVTEWREEGRMVAGRKVGLWCVQDHQFSIGGKPVVAGSHSQVGNCSLSTGKFDVQASTGRYRKLPDGRWQLWSGAGPAEPASFLAAGELEVRSEKMIAAAMAGQTNLQAEVKIETRALDDLVRGAKITLAPEPGAISLKNKRVAVVLSSQTLAELERFRRERQTLVDGTLGMAGEAAKIRARFITASSPERMLEAIVKLLRGHAREIVPADTLAGMREAGIDFALVVDWRSLTRMDLLGKYDAFPVGAIGDPKSALVGNSLSVYLLTPDLRAVRQHVEGASFEPKFAGRADNAFESGDSGYLFRLARHFEASWGRTANDSGRMVSTLKFFLDRN